MDEDGRRRLTLYATVLGSSLAFIDATAVIVALPAIGEDLGLDLGGRQWIFLSYSLALASFYLAAGAIGDRLGRREVFVAGAVAFALTSVLAGLAPDGATLIVARVLQGVAGAFLTTNSLALLREVYGRDAGRAVGLWTALTGVATIAGPPAGGAIVEWVSWRWIFIVNLPLAALTVVLALCGRCRLREQHTVGRLDVPGALLAAVGFGALTYGLVQGGEEGFGSAWWALLVAAAALGAFFAVELRSREPMLPLRLFRRRNFAASNLETFFAYAALGGMLLYFALFLQFLGFSPFEAGLINIPTSLVMIGLSTRVGTLADRFGPRLFLAVGPALIGAGMLFYLPLAEKSDFWLFGIPGLALFSVGLALTVAPITSTALSSVPGELAGVASGVNQTVARLGGLLAVAVIGLVVTLVFESSGGAAGAIPLARGQLDPDLRAASLEAFRAGTVVAAALAFVGALVGLGISNEEARAAPRAAPATGR